MTVDRSAEDSLILTLLDVATHVTKAAEGIASRADLTVQQWLVLLQIAGDPNFPPAEGLQAVDGPGVGASDIAAARGVSRAHIGALVSSLLRKKLIRQTEEPRDRRRKSLVVTARGRRALERIEPTRHTANRILFSPFGRKDLAGTEKVLTACLRRLRDAGPGYGTRDTARFARKGA